jgi:hypothetical protein
MSDDNGSSRTDGRRPGGRYRLAWRWTESGTTGRGPWMHRPEIVETWKEQLSRRFRDMEHWIETDGRESHR